MLSILFGSKPPLVFGFGPPLGVQNLFVILIPRIDIPV